MRVCVCMTAIAVGTCMAGRTSAQMTFQGLGDLPGGIFSTIPRAISQDGRVVVGRASSAFGTSSGGTCCEAFRWTEETGIVGLGDLPGGAFESEAEDVSSDGSIIVGQAHSGVDVGAVWVDGGILSIPDPDPGCLGGTRAMGVSADGGVVVGNFLFRCQEREAFRTTFAATTESSRLGDLGAVNLRVGPSTSPPMGRSSWAGAHQIRAERLFGGPPPKAW